jgi:2,4-dienoyl-CoA reductase-like NADH-dependent reductase (Old Yellow Enzyme family)
MSSSDTLFSTLAMRGLTMRNRIAVSPMCQYSSEDGFANDWHLVHLGSRAVGGAGLVVAEASAVTPEGRITPWDLGIWKDDHIPVLSRIAEFIEAQGAVPAIQLAHAGRKASTRRPWDGGTTIPVSEGGWTPLAPSPIPFRHGDPPPAELTVSQIDDTVEAFVAAAQRAESAGFRAIELHAAHGYLLHEFLSPLSNHRKDAYGGSLASRMRFPLQVARALREAWPAAYPMFVRISATDWVEGGWDIEQSIVFARELAPIGVDLIDVSSGGLVLSQQIPLKPGYQVPFAARIKVEAGVRTGAVGMITEPHQADEIIREGKADIVLLARAMLRDPYWSYHAAEALGLKPAVPPQYQRAF